MAMACFAANTSLQVAESEHIVRMASLFSRREKDGSNARANARFAAAFAECTIPDLEVIAELLTDHRLLRTGRLASLDLQGDVRPCGRVHETVRYPVNGISTFNGVRTCCTSHSYPTIA